MKKVRNFSIDYSSVTFVNRGFDPCITEHTQEDEDEVRIVEKATVLPPLGGQGFK